MLNFSVHLKTYFFFEKETVDDEERGRDGIGGVEVEKLSIWARFLPESDGGGGEGHAHPSQVVAIWIHL